MVLDNNTSYKKRFENIRKNLKKSHCSMWVNVDLDGECEMVRKLTGMLVSTRQGDDEPLTVQIQRLKRIGDEAKLYHVSSRHTAVIASFNSGVVLKHSFKALGKPDR